jgi:hypothetical protein
MLTRSTDRRPRGAARLDPHLPVLRQTTARAMPDVDQPLKSARRGH